MKDKKAQVRFSIGKECISCAACWRAVPEHFSDHEIHGNAIVSRQPETKSEVLRCEEALRICPVQAITRDPSEDPPE
jgi:ferredoxin